MAVLVGIIDIYQGLILFSAFVTEFPSHVSAHIVRTRRQVSSPQRAYNGCDYS